MVDLLKRTLDGHRLTPEEALTLLQQGHWAEMAHTADLLRLRHRPGHEASFTMFRMINYTNVCDIACKFCSFKQSPRAQGAYVLLLEEIEAKVAQGVALGAHQVFFQGGVNPQIPLDYYIDALLLIKSRFGVHIRGFSPVELQRMAVDHGESLPNLLKRLKEAGLDSVPGAGAEILSDRVRRAISPQKLSVEKWLEVLRHCHDQGLFGSANIVFGSIENAIEIVDHLQAIRALQDETRGFYAFIPWTFQKQTHNFPIRHVPSQEYIKVLALTRLYLDNIPHIEASVLGLGPQMGELALRSGADDISSPVIEENVMESHGLSSQKEAIIFLHGAGFDAIKRDFNYHDEELFPRKDSQVDEIKE